MTILSFWIRFTLKHHLDDFRRGHVIGKFKGRQITDLPKISKSATKLFPGFGEYIKKLGCVAGVTGEIAENKYIGAL